VKRRLNDGFAVAVTAALRQLLGEPFIVGDRKIAIWSNVDATCLRCGLSISVAAHDDHVIAYYEAQYPRGGWLGCVHEECPTIIDHVDWFKTRRFDLVLGRHGPDALTQVCQRCFTHRKTPFRVLDLSTLRPLRVCEECVSA
jgi:hypothetical protein